MKRGLSKAERDRREQQRAEAELMKGVDKKQLAQLAVTITGPGTTPTVWGYQYQQFVTGAGANSWALPNNPAGSLSSQSQNQYAWSPIPGTTVTAYPQFLGNYLHPSNPPSPLKLSRRTVGAPVVGYRSWHIEFPEERAVLHATGVGVPWPGLAIHAKCGRRPPLWNVKKHRAPHEQCVCGIHAYKELANIGVGGGVLWGAVLTWGKHVEHGNEGYRAAHARVIAFTILPKAADYKTWLLRTALAEAASEKLGVPLIPIEKLEMYAREFGEPLD